MRTEYTFVIWSCIRIKDNFRFRADLSPAQSNSDHSMAVGSSDAVPCSCVGSFICDICIVTCLCLISPFWCLGKIELRVVSFHGYLHYIFNINLYHSLC